MEYNIVDTIMMLNEQCCHLHEQDADENGLSSKEMQVLLTLKPDEIVSGHELARRNLLSPSRMSRIIDGLAAKRYLTRETDEHDRRVTRLSLTPEGTAKNKSTMEFKKRCESKITSKLTRNEFAVIQKALRLLLFAMEEEHGNDLADAAGNHQ
jgi:DNA-binding MarR family transcriptional regulator